MLGYKKGAKPLLEFLKRASRKIILYVFKFLRFVFAFYNALG